MELSGSIKMIGKTVSIGERGFKKREMVLNTDQESDYPQVVLLEFTQDKTNLLDKFKVGDKVIAKINIRGREWVNPEGVSKFFNSLQAWSIVKSEVSQVSESIL